MKYNNDYYQNELTTIQSIMNAILDLCNYYISNIGDNEIIESYVYLINDKYDF